MTDKSSPVTHEQNDPKLIGHLGNVHPMMAVRGLEQSLSALIELRSSQINQCAYCVNMHINDARKAQVSQEKLDKLVVWRHVEVYTPAERAALAWTEALTVLEEDTDYGVVRRKLN